MTAKKNKGEAVSGILLLAKKSGRTSFASLSTVKHALNTGKVGHTGTLDSFADGLLVVLTGRLTHLVPHITNCSKRYSALIEFGTETDTLDPTGTVVRTGGIPSEDEVRSVLRTFVGEQEQVPPLYSALHVGGKRASDLARDGKEVELKARHITVHSIELVDFSEKYALVNVECSKGTYVRALARDIARKCGTVAHLKALRRTKVGHFELKDAVGFSELGEFSIKSLTEPVTDSGESQKDAAEMLDKIPSALLGMDFKTAELCSLTPAVLSLYFINHFSNGKPLSQNIFSFNKEIPQSGEIAVFYPKGTFAGVVKKIGKKFSYSFVIPYENSMVTYSWDDVTGGKIEPEFLRNGTSLTIGSFDGPHIGHDALFDAALSERKNGLVPGVVTFTRSLRAMKNPAEYPGDISSLSQKLSVLEAKGFAFAIVIDFSAEFAKIEGIEFLKVLLASCRMKALSEGKDFHCGYKGTTGIAEISAFCEQGGFRLSIINSVILGSEKVSSTRCRNVILKADFSSVNYMLDRHFTLDCSEYEWEESVVDGKRIFFAKKKGIQILPPDGSYKVLAVIEVRSVQNSQKSGEAKSSVNVRAYRSDCTLEKGYLRLSFSDKLISGFVRAVQFGYPDEK